MQKPKLCHTMFASLAICLGVAVLYAQAGSGTIVGTISDPTGAVVPSVSVKVVNQDTGEVRRVTTNSQGYYVVPSLAPAVYSITASGSDFAAFTRTDITLLADQHLTVDLQMKLASASQTVSVSAIPPLQVDTTSSTLSNVVEQRRIVDLPLDGRNPVQLALLGL